MVLLEHQSFYSIITLNRPEKYNAFHAEMIQAITNAVKEARERKENKCLVIRANGKHFSAGADLNYMKETATFSQEENIADSQRLYDLFDTIYQTEIPTICLVHGAAFGGANGMIAACDVAFATTESQFSFSEVKIGLIPATISPFVVEKIGKSNAVDLFTSGRRFTAQEAKEMNLIRFVAANQDEMEKMSQDYLENLRNVAPKAMRASKILARTIDKPNQESREKTAKLIAKARTAEEGQEGLSAFLEKRKPKWTTETE